MADDSLPSILTRSLSYRDEDTPLTGVLCWPDRPDPSPGIMLIHGGGGLDAHARDQAQRYAQLGYTVLACDMYGDGVAGDRERRVHPARAERAVADDRQPRRHRGVGRRRPVVAAGRDHRARNREPAHAAG